MRRGCNKPGYSLPRQEPAVLFLSPMLQADGPMDECPVGFILRTSPHTYQLAAALQLVDNASPREMAAAPTYFQQGAQLWRSEQPRLQEIAMKEAEGKRRGQADADYAATVLRRG